MSSGLDLKDYIADKGLKKIVQAGMSIGIASGTLAGSAMAQNAIGTIGTIGLENLHQDLLDMILEEGATSDAFQKANCIAIDREIKLARTLSKGKGLISANVMDAIWDSDAHVLQACKSGVDIITMGAGLPTHLAELTKDFPDVKLVPILSEKRGVKIILKKWMKHDRLPFAIVIENPKYAAGHLGAIKFNFDDPIFRYERVYNECQEVFQKLGIKPIPLIAAGGVTSASEYNKMLEIGYDAVQMGTIFSTAKESSAHDNFKKTILEAKKSDIVEFMSCAGYPCRAVNTPWVKKYLSREKRLREKATPSKAICHKRVSNKGKPTHAPCLKKCGYREGNGDAGQFCIYNQLTFSLSGDLERGLYFRGTEQLPFTKSVPVKEIFEYFEKEGNLND